MARRRAYISFEAVKAATDLAALVEESGVEVTRSGTAVCPFHEDRRPSLSVRAGRWRCFGCGAHGDAFDWAERFYGLDTAGALRFLAARAGIGPAAAPPPAAASADRRRKRLRESFFAWVGDERSANVELLRRLDKTIDLFVTTPDDLATETAKYLFDTRARLEGTFDILWGRDYETLTDYYREKTIGSIETDR